jgi:protein-tyrosine phosphatase
MIYSICFVCLGNICRSPIAAAVMRSLVNDAGLDAHIEVSSAGTGDWHVGQRADNRALATLTRHGYDGSTHRARQFVAEWFADHDLVVALDSANLADLRRLATTAAERDKVRLLLSFDAQSTESDVPDPYYGGAEGFDLVVTTIERACRALLEQVRTEIPA